MAKTSSRPTGFKPGDYPEITREKVNEAIEQAFAEAGISGVSASDIEIAQIWAQTTAGIIGDGKDMPWYLPEDLKHFQRSTMGYPVVMGRTSWEALEAPYRPLPGRENWVVTRNEAYSSPGGHRVSSLSEAIAQAAVWISKRRADEPETELTPTVWILGGGQVYAQCMPISDRVVITEIDMVAPERFSVHAPEIPADEFEENAGPWETSDKGHPVDSDAPVDYRICEYVRR
ncbi:dihydrofolate reductase [Corynebacterium sp. zg254]|uniref:dihydrofolate reductase n=1 Tax=Corynebacterium zhongnanshanii TaxID=2768834 RepID=A0ABQ6VE52_9CORY|nr:MULTISPECIES: dihydrofolate reductase [Corynebacterium]KAB3521023.1 dihydrofolate reductase [Corynebacterium zhongnanshanii]MCR5914665.1 dihydrofolate reductase [Corynebacterium sp. zg254]